MVNQMSTSRNNYNKVKNRKYLRLALCCLVMLIIIICSCDHAVSPVPDNIGEFTLETPYTYIRSHSTGGGVLIVKLIPGEKYSGNVTLNLIADQNLNAQLDKTQLNEITPVVEITIRPNLAVEVKTYQLKIIATNSDNTDTLNFDIEILIWPSGDDSEGALKRDEFTTWLESEYPEYGSFSEREWFSYLTYPQILIVTHLTYLDDDWEVRLCYHVMIPPYDWSYIRLRRRGEVEPAFAAKRESDGTIYEVSISDYPILFDY
jgi:hypothetical protein